MHPLLLEDAWVRDEVERVVAPYAGSLSAENLAWIRDQVADRLATEPSMARLLRRAHPAPVDRSNQIPTGYGAPKGSVGKKVG
jgi:hypothetical protein